MMHQWFWGFSGYGMIFIWLTVIVVAVLFLAILFPKRSEQNVKMTESMANGALAILKRRYARGEITRQEFEKMRVDIEAE